MTWQPVLPVLVALAVVAAPAGSAEAATGAERGVAYLEQARNADGGWGGAPGQASNGLHTPWAAYAMAAAGKPVAAAPVILDRLGDSRDIGDVLRSILGLKATGGDPRAANGRDLVAELLSRQKPNGSIAGYTSFTSSGVMALVAAGETEGVEEAASWMAAQANRDGGFTVYRRGGPSNADDTAAAIEALVAAGRRGTRTVRRAVRYLRRTQAADGGYALTRGAPTNAQSTAFAVLGLVAAGVDPESVERNGRSPLDYLRRLQDADGSFRYSKSSRQTPVWVTAQAVLALRRAPLPVVPAEPPTRGVSRSASAPFTVFVWN